MDESPNSSNIAGRSISAELILPILICGSGIFFFCPSSITFLAITREEIAGQGGSLQSVLLSTLSLPVAGEGTPLYLFTLLRQQARTFAGGWSAALQLLSSLSQAAEGVTRCAGWETEARNTPDVS